MNIQEHSGIRMNPAYGNTDVYVYRVLCTRCLIHVLDDRVENIHRKDAATEESNDSSTVDPETEGWYNYWPPSRSHVHPCLGLIFSCLPHCLSLSLPLPPLPVSLPLPPLPLSLTMRSLVGSTSPHVPPTKPTLLQCSC